MPPLASVIVPVYNEGKLLPEVLRRLRGVQVPGASLEVIVVDDGSVDGSGEIAAAWQRQGAGTVIRHPVNRGKGAALQSGIAAALGEWVLIHDADLEYDSRDLPKLITPLQQGTADVVYGNRMHRGNPVGYRRYWLGNYAISLWASLLFGRRIHDVETGAKAFRRSVLVQLHLAAERFDIEVELTARTLQGGWRFTEVPIRYSPRRFGEGKKISWRDGVQAFWLLLRYRLEKPQTPNPKPQTNSKFQ